MIYIGFTLFLTAFFFFFISSGYGKVPRVWSANSFPRITEDITLDLLHKFDKVIAGFVRGRITIAFIQSIIFSLGYWMIGVPAPVLLGVGVAVLSIVPYAALVGIPVSIGSALARNTQRASALRFSGRSVRPSRSTSSGRRSTTTC